MKFQNIDRMHIFLEKGHILSISNVTGAFHALLPFKGFLTYHMLQALAECTYSTKWPMVKDTVVGDVYNTFDTAFSAFRGAAPIKVDRTFAEVMGVFDSSYGACEVCVYTNESAFEEHVGCERQILSMFNFQDLAELEEETHVRFPLAVLVTNSIYKGATGNNALVIQCTK